MNLKYFYTSGNQGNKELYDKLFFSELGLTEITNNDEVMVEFTNKLDLITNKTEGYSLFSIDIKMKHNVILICKSKEYGSNYNFCYILSENKSIDTGTSIKIEEEKDIDLHKFIKEKNSSCILDELDIIKLITTKTMLGYRINKTFATNIIDNLEKYENVESTTIPNNHLPINKTIEKTITSTKKEIYNKYNNLVNDYELPLTSNLDLEHIISNRNELLSVGYNFKQPYIIGKIDEIYELNNKRIALITIYDGITTTKLTTKTRPIDDIKPLTYKSDNCRMIDLHNINYRNTAISNIEYNYLDKNRYFIILGDGNYYKHLLIFQDPKIKELTIEDINNELSTIIEKIIKENIDISNCKIEIIDDNKKKIILNLSKYINDIYSKVTYKDMQKALKSMYNEYNYIIKKNKSEGSDIKITDDLTYFHESGKISYNDFSIETDLEPLKEKIYNNAKNYMLNYFRKELTEEKIISLLTENFYKDLDYLLITTTYEHSFNIKFNDKVNVLIEVSKNDAHFTYINGNRINKNEISSILTEVSCYSSQEAANKFIENICKKGLSVFIGVSSGYFHNDKFYKFKTKEKSGEYIMNIDNIEINIKGKKLFNTLFSIAFKNERSSSRTSDADYINNHVFASVSSKFDYIKYKIMIDKSYQIFINKSKEFLNKKVIETEAEYIKYFDKNQNKIYDGVKVIGTSGKEYIIAYTLKESFVFMNPIIDNSDYNETLPVYTSGTYICMIDQSKMKATVGYDTVVSKLLSLRHDSVIASTIYNLEDELNK